MVGREHGGGRADDLRRMIDQHSGQLGGTTSVGSVLGRRSWWRSSVVCWVIVWLESEGFER